MARSDRKVRWGHWGRLVAALAAGIAASLMARGHQIPMGASLLIAWNAAAATYVILVGHLILASDEDAVRHRARQEDENRAVLMSVILTAALASLGAMVIALHDAHTKGKEGIPPWVVILSASTIVLGWMLVQSLFTLHYAHRYFADRDDDGEQDGGIDFPGKPPSSYRDFLYVAVCIGATCQVSDFDITDPKVRNLVTVHAALAFVFNTMVLALGVNIIGNLMGAG